MTGPHDHRVLVPVDVLGGQAVPETIIDAFASVPVVLLGYHVIPDQTTPEQARSNFERQAQSELEDLQDAFEAAGGDVTTRLVFTHDRFTSFERAAVELHCDGVLVVNPTPKLERILVAIRGDVSVEHLCRLIAAVFAESDVAMMLLHVASSEEARARGRDLLDETASTLVSHGVDRDRIEVSVVDGAPTDAIVDAAADHDLLVIGESRPSIRQVIFRDRAERIARRTIDPVLVIRGEYL